MENGELRIENNPNPVVKKSYDFALDIIILYKFLVEERKEFVLSKQLLRSGTGVGANIREAIDGQSKPDFLSKMNISLKEARESLYWIDLLRDSNYIDLKQKQKVYKECEELIRILTSIVKTTKQKIGGKYVL
ncbi:MAG: four helix bundle protein [Fibromonadaceae bacterium]|jgi:four helix bundle protein|nr:four helix bundle protein [Fibromonadaceae bacterium]